MRPGQRPATDNAKDEGLGAEYDAENAYDTGRFITICKSSWDEWLNAVTAERARALELVTQYPIPTNLSALFELENIAAKMLKVSFVIQLRRVSTSLATPLSRTSLLDMFKVKKELNNVVTLTNLAHLLESCEVFRKKMHPHRQ